MPLPSDNIFPTTMKRFLPFLIILSVLGVALGSAWYLKRSSSASPKPSSVNAPAPAAPALLAPGADPPHIMGAADAPVTLEEFGDFECPPCGMLHPILKGLETEFGPSKIRLVFREFPLVPTHVHALAAARAAEAAGLQGKFWEMHDIIYDHQKDWHEAFDVRPIFEGYATKVGLNLEQFRKDQASEVVERRIFLDGKRAHSMGVTGTPTVFMNGREVPFESLAPEKLRALINSELAALGK